MYYASSLTTIISLLSVSNNLGKTDGGHFHCNYGSYVTVAMVVMVYRTMLVILSFNDHHRFHRNPKILEEWIIIKIAILMVLDS